MRRFFPLLFVPALFVWALFTHACAPSFKDNLPFREIDAGVSQPSDMTKSYDLVPPADLFTPSDGGSGDQGAKD